MENAKLDAGAVVARVEATVVLGMPHVSVVEAISARKETVKLGLLLGLPPKFCSVSGLLQDPSTEASVNALRAQVRANLYKETMAVTTRPKRPAETDGKEYKFVSEEQFQGLITSKLLFEYKKANGFFYGTLKFNAAIDGHATPLVPSRTHPRTHAPTRTHDDCNSHRDTGP